MIRDLKSKLSPVLTLNPAAYATGTGTGTGVDLAGYNGAVAHWAMGAWTNGTHTLKLQESSDNTTFSDVGTADLSGSFTAVSADAAGTFQRVGYIGSKRYIRGWLVTASGAAGMVQSVTIERGVPSQAPTA